LWLDPNLSFDQVFPAGVCPFSAAVTHHLARGFRQLSVFTAHCDQLRRGFDTLGMGLERSSFLLNFPITWQFPAAETLLQRELVRLSKWLVAHGGHAPSWEELQAVCERFQAAGKRLTGDAARFEASSYALALGKLFCNGTAGTGANPDNQSSCKKPYRKPPVAPKKGRAPVALVGGPLPRSHFGLFQMLDKAGAEVVLNATETGECLLGKRPQLGDSLLSAKAATIDSLAQAFSRYALSRCIAVWQRPNSPLYAWLQAAIQKRGPRAILLWHYTGCDLWRARLPRCVRLFAFPSYFWNARVSKVPLHAWRVDCQPLLSR
jgi:hypothetical protein